MFRKKDFYDDERRKEEQNKLTYHFHRSLKCLQQKEHVDGATIVSNEASNNLCSVLEAVFLHGIKDRVVSKLVSYAQGTSNEIKINFWAVVKKFTHKDVIVQLKELTQIQTDIGLCRAWVRLAINDGLMASYLASMTADIKALATFYHPWSYLLDYEQPEILRNHLTDIDLCAGLMNLNFNLSINSNILNKWSSTTVAFAGLAVETKDPPPVIKSAGSTPSVSRRGSQNSLGSMDSLNAGVGNHHGNTITTVTITTTTSSMQTVPAHTAHVYRTATPPNTPSDARFFTNSDDVEALKKLVAGMGSSSWSSCSSSQASCPDPSDPQGRLSGDSSSSGSPMLVKAGGASSSSPLNASPLYSSRPSSYSRPYMTRELCKMEEERKLSAILSHLDRKEREREDREEKRLEEERQRTIEAISRQQQQKEEEDLQRLEEEQARLRQAAEEQYRNWQREKVVRTGEATGQSHQGEAAAASSTNGCKGGQQGSDSAGGADCVENQGLDNGCSLVSSTTNIIDSIEDAMNTVESRPEDKGSGEDPWSQRSSSCGNSLNAKDGWSTASPHADYDQSYESMLRGYHKKVAVSPATTIEDALDGMTVGNGSRTSAKVTKQKSTEDFNIVDASDDDIDFADYEIIHSATEDSDTVLIEQMKSLCKYLGKNAQSNVCATPNCNIGVGFFHGPGVICELDGHVYCEQCHQTQYSHIPAEIIFNWNFKRKKVCKKNFEFLQRVQDQPLFDVDEMCEKIYYSVPQMKTVMELRTRLTSLRSYMFTCSESTARELKDRVWPREHLYNKIHTYSLNDLLEVRNGKLEAFLKDVVDLCQRHVYHCRLCSAKGFYCELCHDSTPIFPFQISTTVKCKNCRNVYHSSCKTDTIACPKCVRYAQRGIRKQADDDADYAYSPV